MHQVPKFNMTTLKGGTVGNSRISQPGVPLVVSMKMRYLGHVYLVAPLLALSLLVLTNPFSPILASLVISGSQSQDYSSGA